MLDWVVHNFEDNERGEHDMNVGTTGTFKKTCRGLLFHTNTRNKE
jgi:hypothetical protein